ncbi:unnamed protein product [Symbiodinium sp. CCMP2592]|nr:unnamed protein product [Symbiodinium sp. CCMP2592]
MAIVPAAEPAVSNDQTSWWAGLAEEWEAIPLLRERMRKGLHLLIPHPLCKDDTKPSPDFVERSVHNCRQNKDVLIPAMKRWAAKSPETVPQVDYLYREVERFFQTCCREDLTPGDTHMDAWTLRKLMTLVKSLLSKNSPPKDEIMAEIFFAFGYEITVEEHLDASEAPEVEPIEDLTDPPEEHSESEAEREDDALVEVGDGAGDEGLTTDGEDELPSDGANDGENELPADGENGLSSDEKDGLPAESLVGDEVSKGASERPCAVGRPVATPQLRSRDPPDVAVPPAPVATESYEHLGSVSSLCDALDGKLHIGDAPEDSSWVYA